MVLVMSRANRLTCHFNIQNLANTPEEIIQLAKKSIEQTLERLGIVGEKRLLLSFGRKDWPS